MESERKWSVDVLGGEQEENEGILELDFFMADDDEVIEEERGSAPPLEACRKNVAEVSACVLRLLCRAGYCVCVGADGRVAADGRSRCDPVRPQPTDGAPRVPS